MSFSESTDVNFFTSHLLSLITTSKPESTIDFCGKYFQRVQSCHHVLGADFSFVNGCKYNRRAFLFCLSEALLNFQPTDEVYSAELQQIVEMLCPDFPRNFVQDGSKVLLSRSAAGAAGGGKAVLFKDMKSAFALHFLYQEWNREIDKLFMQDGSDVSRLLPPFRVRAFLNELRRTFPCRFEQPPAHAVDTVLGSLSTDINSDDFKRALLQNHVIVADLTRFPPNAVSITSLTTMGSMDNDVAPGTDV